MLILSVGLPARAPQSGPAERLLNMLNQQRICAAIYATAFSVNVSLCVALAPVHGGTGAAFATSVAIVIESALAVRRRQTATWACTRSSGAGKRELFSLAAFSAANRFTRRRKMLSAAQPPASARAERSARAIGLFPQRRVSA